MEPHDIEPTILRATGGSHPLDVTFVADEDSLEPWKPRPSANQRLMGTVPESVAVTQANLVYVEKGPLPQSLANRLVRLAAFQNPEFYRAQAMRMPVWDKPRVIGCAENFPQHIGLPRGCLEAVQQLLRDHGIHCDLRADSAQGSEAGRCAADAGGSAALPVRGHRRAVRRRHPGGLPDAGD